MFFESLIPLNRAAAPRFQISKDTLKILASETNVWPLSKSLCFFPLPQPQKKKLPLCGLSTSPPPEHHTATPLCAFVGLAGVGEAAEEGEHRAVHRGELLEIPRSRCPKRRGKTGESVLSRCFFSFFLLLIFQIYRSYLFFPNSTGTYKPRGHQRHSRKKEFTTTLSVKITDIRRTILRTVGAPVETMSGRRC